MASCKNCQKSPPQVKLKLCAKCSVTEYCSRDCQKADWKAHRKICGKNGQPPRTLEDIMASMGSVSAGSTSGAAGKAHVRSPPKGLDFPIDRPFTRLDKHTWLFDRPEIDVYRLLIDSYRMRCEDMYAIEQYQVEGSLYTGAPNGLPAFRKFLDRIETQHRDLLPAWWTKEKRAACEALGMDASQWCDLRCCVEKSDIVEQYGDPQFPMQLRMFAEEVYGRAPGGGSGKGMREIMMMSEGGDSDWEMSHVDVSSGKINVVN